MRNSWLRRTDLTAATRRMMVGSRSVWLAAVLLGAGGCVAPGLADSSDWTRLRERMVRGQLRARDIIDERVLTAMQKVPRHEFVPESERDKAYADHPLPIGGGQTISQPYIVALMSQLLEVRGDERVLEVGTGSGYQAAVLAQLVREVFSIEIDPTLAAAAQRRLTQLGYDNVRVRAGDGFLGWPEAGPFDAIIITAAAPRIPESLVAQLREGGRVVAPVGQRGLQTLLVGVKRDGKLQRESHAKVVFVPMTGMIETPTSETKRPPTP